MITLEKTICNRRQMWSVSRLKTTAQAAELGLPLYTEGIFFKRRIAGCSENNLKGFLKKHIINLITWENDALILEVQLVEKTVFERRKK